MNKLIYWRSKRKLTVRELAAKSKVSPTTINNLEQGYLKSHALTIAKLAEALEVDISELADFIASPKTVALAILNQQSDGTAVSEVAEGAGTLSALAAASLS
jgi:transcriptional regulator with XRE-family HTH domain